MTLDDAPAMTRRALRQDRGADADATTGGIGLPAAGDGVEEGADPLEDAGGHDAPSGRFDMFGRLDLPQHEALSPAEVARAALADDHDVEQVAVPTVVQTAEQPAEQPAEAVEPPLEAATALAVETVPPKTKPPKARPPKAPKAVPALGEARVALGWLDETEIAARPASADLATATSPYVPVEPDLLAHAPHRSPWRPGVLVPIVIGALLAASYAATTLLWPLHEVAPTIEPMAVQPVAAVAATPPWPAAGGAAVAVEGFPGTLASTPDAIQMASITKLVTALTVLDEMPLDRGETGPDFRFTSADASRYRDYLANGESAVKVPVGGVLTQYQMLQAMLLGSANNYADRLAGNLWPSDAVYAAAANTWLSAHGVAGITVVEPSGIDPRNTATPEGLVDLAKKVLANPVLAEIVAMPSVDLPGIGVVENTNPLIHDPGIVGLKTGTLDSYALLTAKDVPIGDVTVRLYASVLGQPDSDTRAAVTRALYDELTKELQPFPSVPTGTTAGMIDTAWGEKIKVVTRGDADVVLWNGAVAAASSEVALGSKTAAGAKVGTLTVTGPLNTAEVDLTLDQEIEGPSVWWRLTHPLDLFGLND